MQKAITALNSLNLIGLSTRTNNLDEMKPEKAKIASMADNYWRNQIAQGFKSRSTPGVTYSVYTAFESDEHGEYTYFLGEAVDTLDDQDLSQYQSLTIAPATYQKFTTEAGKMPDIVINAWQKIWSMDFQGKRQYLADFEIYDHRAADLNSAVVDIYVGIKA